LLRAIRLLLIFVMCLYLVLRSYWMNWHYSTMCSPNLIFITLLPPPPNSTLFPYTTLFRSTPDVMMKLQSVYKKQEHKAQMAGNLDRKSTRLNSSHVSISYAVFCLKKKSHKAASDVRDEFVSVTEKLMDELAQCYNVLRQLD